jgi:hypothetical protein
MLWPFIVSFIMLELICLGLRGFMSWRRVYCGQILFVVHTN